MLHRATRVFAVQAFAAAAIAALIAAIGFVDDVPMRVSIVVVSFVGATLLAGIRILSSRLRALEPRPLDGTAGHPAKQTALTSAFSVVLGGFIGLAASNGTMWAVPVGLAVAAVTRAALAVRVRAWERANPGHEAVVSGYTGLAIRRREIA